MTDNVTLAGPTRDEMPPIVPILHRGVLIHGTVEAHTIAVTPAAGDGPVYRVTPLPGTGRALVDPVPRADVHVRDPDGTSVAIQISGWSGRVERARGGLVTGWARNDRLPDRDAEVIVLGPDGIVARATARAAEGGRFALVLPVTITRAPCRLVLEIGIAGSDFLLENGHVETGLDSVVPPHVAGRATPGLLPQPHTGGPAIRIKISTPNLKEAPLWGDYHFANSLAAAFERIGLNAGVDTLDAWYSKTVAEDVVLTIRGRQPVELDPRKINIMWLISHPDRIEPEEFAAYDHVAVASDVYAKALRVRGLTEVSVLHQATDAHLFGAAGTGDDAPPRKPACLFVGNSRREYRTMVKWCIQKDIPLELYGGGWEGVLPDGAVRAPSVANADLPELYASHLLLLNDHWDSMRDNGFLSNRLFDGSATGTPILTDPVAGLSDVFGDTITEAGDAESFAATIRACLDDPSPFLARAARAREIVLGAHTFDHRAATLTAWIDRIAAGR